MAICYHEAENALCGKYGLILILQGKTSGVDGERPLIGANPEICPDWLHWLYSNFDYEVITLPYFRCANPVLLFILLFNNVKVMLSFIKNCESEPLRLRFAPTVFRLLVDAVAVPPALL